MTEIVWRAPRPPKKARNGKSEAMAAWAGAALHELRRRPGQWAEIRTFRSATRAWGALRDIEDRGLMPGALLKAEATDTGSALLGCVPSRRTAATYGDN